MFCLTSLIRQRISVPELIEERWRNYVITITSSISVVTFISMTYYNQETLNFSHKNLRFADNVLFILYMISSFLACFMTFKLLSKLNVREVPKDCCCLIMKKYLIFLMGVQVLCCENNFLI